MRQKKKIHNFLGIALILVLFATAFFMPRLYFSYYDKINEDEVVYMDAQMNTYQLQYKSMQEKLYVLGKLGAEKENLQITLLQENSDTESQIELTNKVNEELTAFWEIQPSYGDDRYCLVTDLSSCKLYTLHTREETDASFRGISFWQLVYTSENSCEIRVLLDAEFEKIYAVGIYNMTDEYCSDLSASLYMMKESFGMEFLEYIWAEEMLAYFDLYETAYAEFGVEADFDENYEEYSLMWDGTNADSSISVGTEVTPSGSGRIVFYEDETCRLEGKAGLKVDEEKGDIYYETGFSVMMEYLQL